MIDILRIVLEGKGFSNMKEHAFILRILQNHCAAVDQKWTGSRSRIPQSGHVTSWYIYIYIYVCVYIYIYVFIYIYMYIYMYVIYICIYVYIYYIYSHNNACLMHCSKSKLKEMRSAKAAASFASNGILAHSAVWWKERGHDIWAQSGRHDGPGNASELKVHAWQIFTLVFVVHQKAVFRLVLHVSGTMVFDTISSGLVEASGLFWWGRRSALGWLESNALLSVTWPAALT